MKKLLQLRSMVLLLAFAPLTQMNAQCLTATYGVYPAATYTPETCDGFSQNYIVDDAYAGEYSNVNVTTGQTYTFSSDITTDFVTISNSGGTTAYASGVGSVTWVSTITGVVRFYLHTGSGCGSEDEDRSRIVVCGTLPTCPSTTATVPYSMGFEASENFTCITTENVNGATTWGYFNGTAQTASTGSRSIRYNWDGATPGNDWFYTQGLSLTGGTQYTLQFYYKASDGPTYVENLEVKYGTAANAAAMTSAPIVTLAGISSALADPFAVSTTTFTPATTGVYYLGFHNYSIADQAFLYIDDITVTAALSVDDVTSQSLGYYPNPVKDRLNLSYNQTIGEVAVFNLLGQQVLGTTLNATEGSVNMSSLPAGNYIVKVNAGNEVSNIKVLKQ